MTRTCVVTGREFRSEEGWGCQNWGSARYPHDNTPPRFASPPLTIHAGEQLGHNPPLHVLGGHLPFGSDGVDLIDEQDTGRTDLGAVQEQNIERNSQ